ncbi:MAG: hypothetical protein KDK96_01650 [Chlamydiia bacterium]|nr:hypothetical protein [Chlamydiia bacterium]
MVSAIESSSSDVVINIEEGESSLKSERTSPGSTESFQENQQEVSLFSRFVLDPIYAIGRGLKYTILQLEKCAESGEKYKGLNQAHKMFQTIRGLFFRKQASDSGVALEEIERISQFKETCVLPLTWSNHLKDSDETQWLTCLKAYDKEILGRINTFFKQFDRIPIKHQQVFKEYTGSDYIESLVAQTLSQILAYSEHLEGQTICIPRSHEQKVIYTNYTIRMQKLGNNGDLPLMILAPSSEDPAAQPWVICRGTSPYFGLKSGASSSILADVSQPEGLDEAVITSPKSQMILDKVFQEFNEKGLKPVICGHSLGGFMISLMMIHHHDKIERGYGFGSPGVSRKAKEKFYEQQISDDRLIFFANSGDFVPVAGEALIGKIFEIETSDSMIRKHIAMSLNQKGQIFRVDKNAEENQRARPFANKIRVGVGRILTRSIKTGEKIEDQVRQGLTSIHNRLLANEDKV